MERAEVFEVNMTLNRIFIKPQGPFVSTVLIFNRDTEGVKLNKNPSLPLHGTKRIIYGIIGVIKLILCKYLVVISRRSRVDCDMRLQHSLVGVWKVDKVNLIPLAPGKVKLTKKQKDFNEEYILMVLSAFNTKDCYYSNSIDLTLSLRQLYIQRNSGESSENPFIWNGPLLRDLIKIKGLDYYCVRLICGFVQVKYVTFHEELIVVVLVSRRGNKRVGTRFFKTGVDIEGEAANFVETEIILELNNIVSSYTILRGSVPLLWEQRPTLSNPKPITSQPDSQSAPFARHFEYLCKRYGSLLLAIDLSKYSSHGKSIHHLYKTVALKSEHLGLKFVDLDLKTISRKGRNLDERLLTKIKDIGFTWVQNDNLVAQQKGAIRVSCLNCTDLTNTVQSILVNVTLPAMLKTTSSPDIFKPPTDLEIRNLQKSYNSLWLAQGDVIAHHEEGTGALKAHLLGSDRRWSKRIYDRGILIKRWYFNRFEDGFKQDSYDLILGCYRVVSKMSFPEGSKMERFKMMLLHYILPGFMTFSTVLLINVIVEFYEGAHREEKCLAFSSLPVVALWFWFYCKFHLYADAPRLHEKKLPQPIHT